MNFYEQGNQSYLLRLVHRRTWESMTDIISLIPYFHSVNCVLVTCESFSGYIISLLTSGIRIHIFNHDFSVLSSYLWLLLCSFCYILIKGNWRINLAWKHHHSTQISDYNCLPSLLDTQVFIMCTRHRSFNFWPLADNRLMTGQSYIMLDFSLIYWMLIIQTEKFLWAGFMK